MLENMDQDSEPESQPQDRAYDDPNGAAEAALACNCCRRRKLRCSREVPTCQQCRKTGTGCVYETKRAKPGMKAGAIDNIHRRLDALEKLVQQTSAHAAASADQADSRSTTSRVGHDETQHDILSFIAKEFQRFNDAHAGCSTPHSPSHTNGHHGRAVKRRRVDDILPDQSTTQALEFPLPDDDELELVLRAYFHHVHPWIPMLHEGRLRRRLNDEQHKPKLRIVLQAMVLVAARYIQNSQPFKDLVQPEEKVQRLRDYVVAAAMRQLSVENQQALIIIAFNDIGSGLADQAWSIVGSLSRSVEYLQLAVENDETEKLRLSQPHVSLAPPADWTEAEERRRVFWNAFNLDRLCSVMMGWNTSLTSDDVSRRLPSDGIKWRKEDPALTPYFGIWDKSAGRIGNPITFLPSHFPPQQSAGEDVQTPSDTGTSPGASTTQVDMSTVGAFAYCIEATESLSRVNSYFLQQKVNMKDHRDVSSWLTRFKELDLRLVHWKMLLPQKWKVDMTLQPTRMDPNLTLAHITHNTSMILLHQLIAFPLPDWPFKNRLPSLCSADTCQAAAIEIATIAENYLQNAPPSVPVASQFAFCLYIASRAILLQWRYGSGEPLIPQFWSLIKSLDVMAQRWAGPHAADTGSLHTNLAAKYSGRLKQQHQACSNDSTFDIHVLGFTAEIDQSTPQSIDRQPDWNTRVENGDSIHVALPAAQTPNRYQTRAASRNRTIPTRATAPGNVKDVPGLPSQSPLQSQRIPAQVANPTGQVPVPPTLGSNILEAVPQNAAAVYHRDSIVSGELGEISQMLLDQQFMDMDRIISYDDGIFGSGYEGGSW